MMHRRSLLGLFIAPAIIRPGLLMPVSCRAMAIPKRKLMSKIHYDGHWYHDPATRCVVTYADGDVDVLTPPRSSRRFDELHFRIWRDMMGFWHEAVPGETTYAKYRLSPHWPLSLISPEFVRRGVEDRSIWRDIGNFR
jgi:hypothetical protein